MKRWLAAEQQKQDLAVLRSEAETRKRQRDKAERKEKEKAAQKQIEAHMAIIEHARQQAQQDRAQEHKRIEELEKRVVSLLGAALVPEISDKDLVPVKKLPRGSFKTASLCEWKGVQVVKLEVDQVSHSLLPSNSRTGEV